MRNPSILRVFSKKEGGSGKGGAQRLGTQENFLESESWEKEMNRDTISPIGKKGGSDITQNYC